MQVVILAGGQGTRLRSVTAALPKPLVPVGDKPILEILLLQLKRAGADEIILSTGHLAELIRAVFGDGSKWGIKLRYLHEDKPLNTAGPLSIAEGMQENFMVMNGDVLTTMDFRALWKAHEASKAAATIAICERHVHVDFGVVEFDSVNKLKEYKEKPTLTYHVSMGLNVLNRRCLDLLKRGEPLSMPELLLKLKAKGEAVNCFICRDRWLDIGRPEDYELAQDEFQQHKSEFLPDGP